MSLDSVVRLDAAHRLRERALRLALGASRWAVLRDVLAGAVGATRAVRALLYGFERLDAETYAGVVVLVSTGAELATLAAARAAAIDR